MTAEAASSTDPPGPHRVAFRGHVWTLGPQLRDRLWRVRAPAAQPWATSLDDPDVGRVRLTGEFRDVPEARTAVLVVHGLGGSPDSVYMRSAARELQRMGVASLSLALRGADLQGEDFYNIALTADLHAALASPELARFETIYVLGFSMGGHVSLHLAREVLDPRVVAVAAICTPVHLKTVQLHIDRPHVGFYCRYVLAGLKAIYAAVAERRPVPSPVEEVLAARTMFEWDRLTIAPRYGYRGPDDYYEALSVAQHLDELRVPSLLVLAEHDPLVPRAVVDPFLPPAKDHPLEVRWVDRGGHVAFPGRLELGFGRRRGLIGQVLDWFESRGRAAGYPSA